jgi:hypothetical protein
VDMHAMDLVGINGITRVLLVYTCLQGVYPRGRILPLRLPYVGPLQVISLLTFKGPMTTLVVTESNGEWLYVDYKVVTEQRIV